jgi:hypothetical protein
MAGADWCGTSDGAHRAIGIQFDPRIFAATESSDLHVSAEPNSQLSTVAGGTAAKLLSP